MHFCSTTLILIDHMKRICLRNYLCPHNYPKVQTSAVLPDNRHTHRIAARVSVVSFAGARMFAAPLLAKRRTGMAISPHVHSTGSRGSLAMVFLERSLYFSIIHCVDSRGRLIRNSFANQQLKSLRPYLPTKIELERLELTEAHPTLA